jgi:hypothetical protein
VRMYVRLSVCASICMNIRNVQTWMHTGRICTWIRTVRYIPAHARTVRASTARPKVPSQTDSGPACVPSERGEFAATLLEEPLLPRLEHVTSVQHDCGRWHQAERESLLSLLHERPQSEPQEARYDQRRRCRQRRLGAARAHTRAYQRQSAGRGYGTWARARASSVRVPVRAGLCAGGAVCVPVAGPYVHIDMDNISCMYR